MSTECNICVYDEKDIPVSLIYVHSDGYPEGKNGILNVLVPLVTDFIKVRGFYDPSYLAAQLVYALIYNTNQEAISENYFDNSKYTGVGMSREVGNYIEYFYKVHKNKIEVLKTPEPYNIDSWYTIKTIKY